MPHPKGEPAESCRIALLGILQPTVHRPCCCLPAVHSLDCLRRCSWIAGLFVLKGQGLAASQHAACTRSTARCLLLQGSLQPQDIDWGDGAASLSNSSETRSLIEQQGALSASSASRHGGEVGGAATAGMGGGQADPRFAAGGMMGSMGPPQPAGGLQRLHLTHPCKAVHVHLCGVACSSTAVGRQQRSPVGIVWRGRVVCAVLSIWADSGRVCALTGPCCGS